MVATPIKKIKHSMLCVTGLYLKDITNTLFVILHLNVSHLSDCISCFICTLGELEASQRQHFSEKTFPNFYEEIYVLQIGYAHCSVHNFRNCLVSCMQQSMIGSRRLPPKYQRDCLWKFLVSGFFVYMICFIYVFGLIR